ncbi:MAG TPA: sialidase family protein [Terracidiphilus sp.]|jgi:predicted neuraminidase
MIRRISLLLMLGLAARASVQEPAGELIFQPGSVPFASSHASTIVELRGGMLMAAWFGGTVEGNPDVAIWGSRTPSGVSAWAVPVELAREPAVPCWNPVLFHTKDGRLWLYYKFGPSPSTWTAARKYSADEGKTWSPAEHLPAGLIGPVRAKPLVLPDGTIVSGSSTEAYHSWAAWIERSTDNGKTWTRTGPIVPPAGAIIPGAGDETAGKSPVSGSQPSNETTGIIQPSVVSLGGRHLRFYARSTASIARITVADSFDNGVTWTRARPIALPNPNSGIDAVALRDGRVVLVFNNTTSGRTPLNLAVSEDGEHFRIFDTLEDAPGEYSYPAVIQGSSGDLYIAYTWNRKSIRFVRVALARIPK